MKIVCPVLGTLAVCAIAAGVFVYAGWFSFAADEPHSPLVHKLLEIARERSIAVRATGIEVPPLDDATLIAEGAEHYSAMCAGCHLAPGKEDTEIRKGLYPQPPNLTAHEHEESHAAADRNVEIARQFWIIKHGVKASGMAAWGTTHDDASIWGLVAFLQKLPEMSAEEYVRVTAAARDHDQIVSHSHPNGDDSDGDEHDHTGIDHMAHDHEANDDSDTNESE